MSRNTCIHKYTYTYIHDAYIYKCMPIYIYPWGSAYIYIYICVYINTWMYVCEYTHLSLTLYYFVQNIFQDLLFILQSFINAICFLKGLICHSLNLFPKKGSKCLSVQVRFPFWITATCFLPIVIIWAWVVYQSQKVALPIV